MATSRRVGRREPSGASRSFSPTSSRDGSEPSLADTAPSSAQSFITAPKKDEHWSEEEPGREEPLRAKSGPPSPTAVPSHDWRKAGAAQGPGSDGFDGHGAVLDVGGRSCARLPKARSA
ncbi:hypothetical protein CDD83_6792 [Cordyceps sp. RAO-2017]|nr:hypothetical protein CDD83_6792 [Cordyceps sp. RAO-2017]